MSLSSVSYDKNLIFRLIPDVNSVYNNSYAKLISGTIPTISNEYLYGQPLLTYNINKTTANKCTIRIKIKLLNINTSIPFLSYRSGGYGFAIYQISGSSYHTIVTSYNTTYYINGIKDNVTPSQFSTSALQQDTWYDLVFTSTLAGVNIDRLQLLTAANTQVAFCEIYKGILTADEVYNLYTGKRYYDIDNFLVFNMNAKSGYLREYTGKNLTINGNVSVIKDKKTYVIKFPVNSGFIRSNASWFNNPNLTISFWYKQTTKNLVPELYSIDSNNYLAIRYNEKCFHIQNSGSPYFSNNYVLKLSFLNNYVMTRNSSGLVNCYINGVQVLPANINIGVPYLSGTTIDIGTPNFTGYLGGLLYNYKAWNRVLSSTEISEIYTSEKNYYL
jgi:hypothetical protein